MSGYKNSIKKYIRSYQKHLNKTYSDNLQHR